MTDDFTRQSIVEEEHLKLLSLGYMVSGGFSALFFLFGLFYVFIGVAMTSFISRIAQSQNKPDQMPPQFVGWFFGAIGLAFLIFSVSFAILKFLAGSRLKQRRSRIFCMIVA